MTSNQLVNVECLGSLRLRCESIVLSAREGGKLTRRSGSQIFVAVAVQYFGYIKKSMTRVTTGNTQDHGRQLKLAWLFATLTSTVVTLLGVVYFGTSLAVAIWTEEVLASSYFLAVITLISL